MTMMFMQRAAPLARRTATLSLTRTTKPMQIHLVVMRAFSTDQPPSDAPKKQNKAEEPLTNKKLWDRVLTNHPEQHDRTNGDVLYEHSRKSHFGILSAGSLAHIAFWSWFKGYEQSLIEMLPELPEPTFLNFISNDMGSTLGFGSSILLSFLIAFHAKRSVARIAVVSGGDKLRITTHKFFGDFSEPFDVPVAQVSANPNMKKNIILKVGKDRGFYLVDIDGKFYNREKLESMITFRTDFSEHDKMIESKEKKGVIEVRTDLPRTDLKAQSDKPAALPKRVAYTGAKGNLLGRKPATGTRKPKGSKH